MKSTCLTLLVVSVMITQAFGIRCYTCSSMDHPDCKLYPERSYSLAHDCNYGGDFANRCVKATFSKNGAVVVRRECASQRWACDTLRRNNPSYDGDLITCDECSNDLCNSSSAIKATFYVLSLSLLMFFAVWK